MKETIVPPRPDDYNEGHRVPYANELILLSFEGRLKPFDLPEPKYGQRPSYAPGVSMTPSDRAGTTERSPGFFEYWKSRLTVFYG